MRTLWEKAAKAKPRDLEIQTRWFTNAFEDGDWKSAQKVRFLCYQSVSYPTTLTDFPIMLDFVFIGRHEP
jgi:hypothetical protein